MPCLHSPDPARGTFVFDQSLPTGREEDWMLGVPTHQQSDPYRRARTEAQRGSAIELDEMEVWA
jgi:hypothetical protein